MKCAMNVLSARPQGTWSRDDKHKGWKCTVCGKYIVLDIFRWGKFCPNCGAKMCINTSTIINFVEDRTREVGEAVGYEVDSSK